MNGIARKPVTNPFATRHTRPGAVPPLTPAAEPRDLPSLLSEIESAGGSGCLVGPHGSGKSTLLAAIAVELSSRHRLAGTIQLREARDTWRAWQVLGRAAPGTTLCLDGWEQLGAAGRIVTRLLARIRRCRLVVTSHRPVRLGLSLTTATSLPLLRAIVARLPDHGGLINEDDLAASFARHGGNLRESLCDLYDRFEWRARQPGRS